MIKRTKYLQIALGLALLAGCSTNSASEPEPLPLRIEPQISRVVGLNFEVGDRIGLSISNSADGCYCENLPLTYDGSLFTAANLIWHNDLNLAADLVAYYPYDANGAPERFTVATDQASAGCEGSDLLAATATGITPTPTPVEMTFHHLMSKVEIHLTNNSDGEVSSILLGGSIPTATIDLEAKTATLSASSAVEIAPYYNTQSACYEAVVVPQQVAFTLSVATDDGKLHTRTLRSTLLLPAKLYTIHITLTNIEITASMQAQIEDWGEGGTIEEQEPEQGDEPEQESSDPQGETLTYGGVDYPIQTLADGRVWMVENLRYNPAGGEVLAAGLYYPGEELTSEADVATYGLLYTAATALGVEAITSENAATIEGTQGICPEGWHLPTEDEFMDLITACGETVPDLLCEQTPAYYHTAQSNYVDNKYCLLLLSSTPTTNFTASRIQIFRSYTGNKATTTYADNKSAYPVRCIKNQE